MTNLTSHLITNTILFFTFLSSSFFLYKVVTSRNPINAILFLIGFFFNIAFILILLGADYIAILILLLYAGAISIILLFVVMLLDMKDIIIRVEKYSLFFKSLFIFFIVFLNLIILNEYSYVLDFLPRVQYVNWFKIFNMKTNIEVVGLVIFELYVLQFLFIGLSLFIVTVLIISLIINYNFLTKRQSLVKQLDGVFTYNFIDLTSKETINDLLIKDTDSAVSDNTSFNSLIKGVDLSFFFNSLFFKTITNKYLILRNRIKSKIILFYTNSYHSMFFFYDKYLGFISNFFNFLNNNIIYLDLLYEERMRPVISEFKKRSIIFWKELPQELWDEVLFSYERWYWRCYRFYNKRKSLVLNLFVILMMIKYIFIFFIIIFFLVQIDYSNISWFTLIVFLKILIIFIGTCFGDPDRFFFRYFFHNKC